MALTAERWPPHAGLLCDPYGNRGRMDLIKCRKMPCNMQFDKLRDNSVKIGNDEKLQMPSRKRRVHSVSCRHNDDRLRNAFNVFREASE